MLFTIVYISRSKKPMQEDDFRQILTVSRANNAEASVTGMLVYKNGEFMQALEGEREVVEALVERIEKDPRHEDMLVLVRKEVEKRVFSEWNMGFKNLSKIADEGYVDPESFFAEESLFQQKKTALNFLSRFYQID